MHQDALAVVQELYMRSCSDLKLAVVRRRKPCRSGLERARFGTGEENPPPNDWSLGTRFLRAENDRLLGIDSRQQFGRLVTVCHQTTYRLEAGGIELCIPLFRKFLCDKELAHNLR